MVLNGNPIDADKINKNVTYLLQYKGFDRCQLYIIGVL